VAVKASSLRSAVRADGASVRWRVRRPSLGSQSVRVPPLPTRRSLAVGLGILALALFGYLFARETGMFAIDRIEVQGGSPRVDAQVGRALASLVGTSLVGLDGAAVLRRVDALPTVVRADYDRAFPHTLRLTVVPERPVAVLRRGTESWLVSLRSRVMERLPAGAESGLPRIWVSASTPVAVGGELTAPGAGVPARAVGLSGEFAARVATVSYTGGSLVFHLKSGLQLLLGDGGNIRLKVAVAARALPVLPAESTFLDVSVPGRPVSGTGSLPPTYALQGSSRG
jgi:cell division protein FtsQ